MNYSFNTANKNVPNNLLVRYIFALRQFGLFGNLRNKISELYQTSEMAQNKAILRISVRNKKIPVRRNMKPADSEMQYSSGNLV